MSFQGIRNGLGLSVSTNTTLGGPTSLYRLSPSLLLQFAGSQTLDPRITFSRASNATVTGPDGTLQCAPHNLLTFSEQFDNVVWTKTNVTVTANSEVAPDGTATADKAIATAVLGPHNVAVAVSVTAGTAYTHTFYAKAGEYQFAGLLFASAGFGTNTIDVFNLSAGTVVANASGTATITSVGNGWYRCSSTRTASASVASTFQIRVLNTSGGADYTGDGTSGIYIWGAQLNVGSLQPYYPTTVKNLLGFTQEFDNAAWSKSNSSIVTPNAGVAPDGSLTADKYEDGTTNTVVRLCAQPTVSLVAGSVYTLSVSAKAAENNWIEIGSGNASVSRRFNLTNGTTANASVPGWATASIFSIVPEANGYYRCSITFTAASSSSGDARIYMDTGTRSYTGVLGNGLFLWGAQLSDSASLDPYVYNPGAAPAAAAYYGPRFDYDPVTLAPRGLLIEEQRTNLLTYSEQFDNAAWTKTELTVSANQTVAPDGTLTADQVVESTTASATHVLFQTAGSAAVHTLSVYVKANGRPWINLRISGTSNYFNIGTGVLGTISAGNTASITFVGSGWYRCSVTSTMPGSGAVGVRLSIADGNDIYTGDGTSGIFIWGAQLEAGAFATSYIPTTAAAATRAADVAVMTGANFSNWYRQDEGTLFAEGDASLATVACFASIDDTTTNNRIQLRRTTSDTFASFRMASSGGSIDAVLLSGSAVGANKQAASFSVGNQSAASNGALFTGITPITPMPTVTRLDLGNGVGSNNINGHIRRIAYFPRRLANSELQSITS